MSSIASSGGYKAPAGVGSRNDGGGPGSGNFYFQNGPYEEEQPGYQYDDSLDLMGTNPFENLLYIPPTLNTAPSNAMMALKSIAAQIYYKQYLKKKDLALATSEYEEDQTEAQ